MEIRNKLQFVKSLKIISINDTSIIIVGVPTVVLHCQIQTVFSALLQVCRKGDLRLPLAFHSLDFRTFSRFNLLTVIFIHQGIGNFPDIRHRLTHLKCNGFVCRNRRHAQTQIGSIHLLDIGIHFINSHAAVFYIQLDQRRIPLIS